MPEPPQQAATLSWPAVQAYFPEMSVGFYVHALPEHSLIYVKNPKAGSSTLMVWLDRLHTGEPFAKVRRIHTQHRLPAIRDVGRTQVIRMLAGGAYRFSFVRHPLRRFESVYRDKVVRSRNYRRKAAADFGLPVDTEFVSFDQFLDAVEQQDPLSEMDPHWRPQHLNLMHPLVNYDHVGRLESFHADLQRIRNEAGLPLMPADPINVSPRQDADSVYDGRPDLVRRVENLYAIDFELYGYAG